MEKNSITWCFYDGGYFAELTIGEMIAHIRKSGISRGILLSGGLTHKFGK